MKQIRNDSDPKRYFHSWHKVKGNFNNCVLRMSKCELVQKTQYSEICNDSRIKLHYMQKLTANKTIVGCIVMV